MACRISYAAWQEQGITHPELTQSPQPLGDCSCLRFAGAHEGSVTAVAALDGRVWSSGGRGRNARLREWSMSGALHADVDLSTAGAGMVVELAAEYHFVRSRGCVEDHFLDVARS
jgi:hypothetical protein